MKSPRRSEPASLITQSMKPSKRMSDLPTGKVIAQVGVSCHWPEGLPVLPSGLR